MTAADVQPVAAVCALHGVGAEFCFANRTEINCGTWVLLYSTLLE